MTPAPWRPITIASAVLAVAGAALVVSGLLSLSPAPGADVSPVAPTSAPVLETPSSAPTTTPAPTEAVYIDATAQERVTRVAVPSLGIDLPVVVPAPGEAFPLCDVAEIEPRYGTGNLDGVTFLYAHAREGMFWPLLRVARTKGADALVGREVLLWTDALVLRRYRVIHAYPRQHDFSRPDAEARDILYLQTSETSRSNGTKLMVSALLVEASSATVADALPSARPRACR